MKSHIAFIALLALLAAGLTGCGDREPRIDATSEQTTQESIDHIASLMSDDDAAAFHDALRVLEMQELVNALDEPGDLTPEQRRDLRDQRLRDRLHNRTASEIVDQVLQIHDDRTGQAD